MNFLDNITCLPDDIFDLVLRQVNNGTDIHNFKNTSKIFRKYYNDYIKPINVNLFKIKYVISFNNCDINRHSRICKSIVEVLKNFNLFEMHINRRHDSNRTIFDTETIIYLEMITDNVIEHKNKLVDLMNKNNLNNYTLNYNIIIYFTDAFIENVINNYRDNNNDIIINNVSLQKINNYEEPKFIYDFTDILKDTMHECILNNDRLYISKNKIVDFLTSLIKNKEKDIEDTINIMDQTSNESVISENMLKLDNIVNNIHKYKNMLNNMSTNILKNNFENRNIKKLNSDFELVNI